MPMRLTRVEALSDGVFAIILTLLVLELKVPALADHASVGELLHHLYEALPKFVSWLISFVILCKFWSQSPSHSRIGAPRELRDGVAQRGLLAWPVLHPVPDCARDRGVDHLSFQRWNFGSYNKIWRCNAAHGLVGRGLSNSLGRLQRGADARQW
jgi:hypothetical protein